MFDGGIRRGMDAVHRAVHGRQVRVRRPPDALRRDRGRHTGRRQGCFSSIFRREIDITMAQIGATKIADLGPQFLMWKDEEDLRRNRR